MARDSGKDLAIVENRKNWLQSIKDSGSDYLSTLTEEEKEQIAKAQSKSKNGFYSSVPMLCTNHTCPFKNTCSYYKIGKAPEGLQCQEEIDLLVYHIEKYAEEYSLDPNNHTDLIMLTELAECIIYETRATKTLATPEANQMLLVEERFTTQGDVYTETNLHPSLMVKEKMKERRLKLLKELIGTRKEKVKIMKDLGRQSEWSKKTSDLRDRIKELSKELIEKDRKDIVEAEFKEIEEHGQ